MHVSKIKDQSEWDKLFTATSSPSFLQSWEWGSMQETLNHELLHVKITDKDNTIAIAQVIKQRVKRGNFLYIPHGPLFLQKGSDKQGVSEEPKKGLLKKTLTTLLNYLKDIATKEGFTFIRIAPIVEDTEDNRDSYANLGFRKAPIFINADEHIWVLPIEKPEEELLQDMRKTTRYLIRRAPKDGVEIEKRTDENAVDDFWPVYEETTKRENFSPFSKTFIRNEFKSFDKSGNALFLFGRVNATSPSEKEECSSSEQNSQLQNPNSQDYLASALVVFTKTTAFYHQGASIHTKFPVPYRLQWEAICEAKKRGCTLYNFWGVAPEGDEKHPWKGLSLFKRGFGGYQINYLPTQDYILSPRYYLTYAYETWLRWRRGV
jgi:lipid II:glycine glycyltransferase (peptidoglycan interpeptide bridge formation enzyme)